MRDFRDRRGGRAIMILETDGDLPPGVAKAIGELPYVHRVILIKALRGC